MVICFSSSFYEFLQVAQMYVSNAFCLDKTQNLSVVVMESGHHPKYLFRRNEKLQYFSFVSKRKGLEHLDHHYTLIA